MRSLNVISLATRLRAFAAIAMLLSLDVLLPPAASANDQRANIVVVLADDLGYGDLACYGNPVIQTPHLDQFAREGLRFTDCYAAAANCSPARTGLMTGRTPYRVGIHNWIPMFSPMHVRRSEITIATLLRDAGYATCHVGKWHLNGDFNLPSQPQPSDHGFDHWFSTQNNALPNHKNPVNFVRNGKPVGPLEGYAAPLVADEAIAWLENLGDPYVASAYDVDGRVGIDWGVYGAPETFLVSPDGDVIHKYIGPMHEGAWQNEFLPLIAEFNGGTR